MTSLGQAKWKGLKFVPLLAAAVAIALLSALVVAGAMGIGILGVLLETGWVFLLAVLGALATYRIMLSRADHRANLENAGIVSQVHLWFLHRESRVDHLAIPLTIGAVLYTLVVGIVIIWQIFESVIHKLATLLTLHW